MPFILVGVGLVLLLTGIKGDPAKLYDLIAADFTGQNNYLYWMFAILVLGFLGYIKTIQPFSRAFIVLVVVVLFLHNQGFITKFQQQVFGAPAPGSVTP